MTDSIQFLGRPPRINFIVSTDYAESMNHGGAPGPGQDSITLHLEVLLTPAEASSLRNHLTQQNRPEAQAIVEAAVAREVRPNDPLGARCRAFVGAAFAP